MSSHHQSIAISLRRWQRCSQLPSGACAELRATTLTTRLCLRGAAVRMERNACRLSLRPASSGSHAGAPSGMADAVAHPHIEPGHARGSDCLQSKMPKIEADTVATNPSPSLADESYSFAPLRVLQLYSCKGQGRTTHTAVELSTRDFRYVQDQADGPWSMAIACVLSCQSRCGRCLPYVHALRVEVATLLDC